MSDDTRVPSSISDGAGSRMDYALYPTMEVRNKQGDVMLQIKFKHEYQYVMIKEFPQHISDDDQVKLDQALNFIYSLARNVMDYRVYDSDEIMRNTFAEVKKLNIEEREKDVQVDIKVQVEDKARNEMNTLTLGITPTARTLKEILGDDE